MSDTSSEAALAATHPKAARHVEHLSPVQLYKKRANDRDNQRISRARKKNRVKCLEEENAFLKARLGALEGRPSPPPQPQVSSPLGTAEVDPRIWQVRPVWIPPMCRMDQVIDRLTSAESEIGGSYQDLMSEITQLTFPSIPSLLTPESASASPLTSVIGKHGQWMNIASPAAMTAVMYNICVFLRENYMALPTHLRPTPLQLLVPHPRWMDIIVWPRAREQLITKMDCNKDFWEYRNRHNSTVSVNWPNPLSDILVSDNSDNIILSPQFLDHVRNEANWTVGPELAEALPYLQCIPVHSQLQG